MNILPSETLYHKGILVKAYQDFRGSCYNCQVCIGITSKGLIPRNSSCTRCQFGRTYFVFFRRVFQ